MGGWVESLACADPGARTPIGTSGNFVFLSSLFPEHLRRRLVRLLTLYRGFILTKKWVINPQKLCISKLQYVFLGAGGDVWRRFCTCTCTWKFPFMSIGSWAEGLVVTRTSTGVSRNFWVFFCLSYSHPVTKTPEDMHGKENLSSVRRPGNKTPNGMIGNCLKWTCL